ncbi:MAG TPA: hypothetical protein VK982_01750 [Bacteroidales bacterium]|nr:hypothetical protein [Bacteroidales bacterium]
MKKFKNASDWVRKQENIAKNKKESLEMYRIRDNKKGFDIPVPLSEWVNNSIYVDAEEGRYTNLGKWNETK